MKTYQEYNNCDQVDENFYEWINKKQKTGFVIFSTIVNVLLTFFQYATIEGWEKNLHPFNNIVYYILFGFTILPLVNNVWKKFIRILYNLGAENLRHINRKVRKIEEALEDYPEFTTRIENIKINLRRAIDARDKVAIKKEIYKIYRLSEDIRKRRVLKDIFKKTEEEEVKEEEIKKIDPFGEEDWSEK